MNLPEIRLRVKRLKAWVESPGYRHHRVRDQDAALTELRLLRRELVYLRWLKERDGRDTRAWESAKEWVESDAEESEAELLESLSRTIPQHEGESDDSYVARLRRERQRFGELVVSAGR